LFVREVKYTTRPDPETGERRRWISLYHIALTDPFLREDAERVVELLKEEQKMGSVPASKCDERETTVPPIWRVDQQHSAAIMAGPSKEIPGRESFDISGRPGDQTQRSYSRKATSHSLMATGKVQAWAAEHPQEIADMKVTIKPTLDMISAQCRDQSPASTLTRAARLLVGANKTPDEAIEALYAARMNKNASGAGSRCKTDAQGLVNTTCLYLRWLTTLCGGPNNPAWIPEPSERGERTFKSAPRSNQADRTSRRYR
jgi:hypothetical protein